MSRLFELLDFRAALDPDGIAVQRPKQAMTWRRFHAAVRSTAAALREKGVRPGQLVVTSLLDKGMDWTLTLALAHEGAISCSNQGRSPWACGFAYDWLITDETGGYEGQSNVIRMDAQWLERLRTAKSGAIEPQARPADAPARIVLTSGTTGERKAVPLTEAQIAGRALDSMKFRGCTLSLSLMQLSGAAELNACAMALLFGAPIYVSPSAAKTVVMVREFAVDGLFGSPLQLGELVRHLEKAGENLHGVRIVRAAGAAMPAHLLEAIGNRITPNVLCLYGSTEAGGMAAWRPAPGSDPAVTGVCQPGSTVEIVDEEGTPVPEGEEGAVRVRSPWMAEGYFRDPYATAQAFRGGWFHPGDRGSIEGGVLKLSGRDNEVINRGGMKLNPVVLDDFMAAFPGVRDAAVFMTQAGVQAGRIVAAVVAGEGFEMPRLRQAMAERFKGMPAPEHFLGVTHIPRTPTGKVRRAEMARLFAAREAKAANKPR